MLGILLTILKIIGIILLVLLGLILAVAAVILLVPIRYQGEGTCEGKVLSGSAKVTWFFHLLSLDISLSADKKVFRVRLFGRVIYPKTEKNKKKSKKEKTKSQPKKQKKKKKEKSQLEGKEQPVPEEKSPEEQKQEIETVYEPQASIPELPKSQTFQSEYDSDTKQAKSKAPQELQKTKKSKPHRNLAAFIKLKIETIKKKLLAIKDKFLATRSKLQKNKTKIEYWKKLLTSEPMKQAIAVLWKYTKGLLRHILPQKLTGCIRFGFDDPSMTGKVLAYLSMLYPCTKDNLSVEPEFETEELILEGNLAFRGRIRLGYLVYVVLRVILDKNIRRQYKRLRQGGKKDGKGRN